MIREKSAGAVVYFPDGENIYILIEKMKQGHYSFPKGHMEGVETEAETAIREIREETGLEVVLDTGFRKTVEYSPIRAASRKWCFLLQKRGTGIIENRRKRSKKSIFSRPMRLLNCSPSTATKQS